MTEQRTAIMKNPDGTFKLGFDGLTPEQAKAILEVALTVQKAEA